MQVLCFFAGLVHLAAAYSKAQLQILMKGLPRNETKVKENQLLVIETAYLAFFAALLVENITDVPAAASNLPVFDPIAGNFSSVRISCDVVDVDLPYILEEFCCNSSSTGAYHLSECVQPQPGCADPYGAYVDWCDPMLCHELREKTHYLFTMQMLAAIGGLYGTLTLFVVVIIWNCCVLGCCRQ